MFSTLSNAITTSIYDYPCRANVMDAADTSKLSGFIFLYM